VSALAARLERLEKLVAEGGPVATRQPEPPPVDPATGRAMLGARAKRAPATTAPASGSTPPTAAPAAPGSLPASATAAGESTPPAAPETAAVVGESAAGPSVPDAWNTTVKPGLKPLVRALFSAGGWAGHDGDTWRFGVPTEPHREKCEAHRPAVEAALSAAVGRPISLTIVVGVDPLAVHEPAPAAPTRPAAPSGGGRSSTAVAATEAPVVLDDEADIDLDDLTDVPPESVLSPIDRLAQAFPGAELVDE
jgi:hypothetical protein